MKSFFRGCILILSIFSGAAAANPTVPRTISSIDFQGADGTVLIRAAEGWGISCAGVNVDAVYFNEATVPAYDAMLSMVLSAYMAKKTVRFYGGCDPVMGDNYFKGTYLILSDQ